MDQPSRTFLHVVPLDLARGAQIFLQALCDELNGEDRHEIVTLFEASPTVLRPDHALGVPNGRLRMAGFNPQASWRLRTLIRTRRPDAVVAHGGESLKYAAFVTPRPTRLVYYKIGIASSRLSNPVRGAAQRATIRRADAVAAVSREAAEEAHKLLGVPEDRLSVVPNGRDADVYRPAQTRRHGPPRMVFVGHLTRTKRPERFIAAVAELRSRGADLEAAMVGAGPLAGSLEGPAAAAGVMLLGRRNDVPDILADADLLMFTSLSEGEGMPGVLIEAGLSGLPVITTDVPGASTVIQHRETGVVVDVDDMTGLVDGAFELLADHELRATMSQAARAHCVAQFSLRSSTDQWRALLDSVVGDSRSPG